MPMTREEHEALITRLTEEEVTHTERIEILSQLRQDYASVVTDFEKLNQNLSSLSEENKDLLTINSRLFRQIGQPDTDKDKPDAKTFSEQVTLSELLKGVNP